MLALALTVAVIGLAPRPTEIAGPDPAAYAQWLAAKTIEFDAAVAGERCDAAIVSSLGGTNAGPPFLQAPLPDAFEPTSLIEHLKIEGCGRVRLPNTLVLRLKAGGWRAVGLLDGASNADARLQLDAIGMAKMSLLANASCPAEEAGSGLRIGEVTIVTPRGADGVWEERWPAIACGKPVAVTMRFSPNPLTGGTAYEVTRTH